MKVRFSDMIVSSGALCIALASSAAFAQPATVPAEGSQPGAPTAAMTAPQPGQAAADPAIATDPAAGDSGQFLDTIVVTGSRQGKTAMQSSTSTTSLNITQITQFTPRSEADVLHLIPGIRVESTAGAGGNSNITVRGLPLASGGAKYVQLQENGLPDVEFGDIAFGNNDFWLRYDYTVANVQAVRGGNASTGASQAPGAIINYISKTGEVAGGRIGISTGLGYNDKRLDFNYGTPVSDTLRFNIGGFVRRGDGPRDISYNAMSGYQVKANVTKTFNDGDGYIRLNLKRLDDRAPSYTSAPFGVKINDNNKITGYYKLPGFDARKDTSFSRDNLRYPIVQPDGSVTQGTNKDGISVRSSTVGFELHNDFSDIFSIDDRAAYTWNRGSFAVPFYGSLTSAAALTGANPYTITAGGVTYRAATARFATGPNAGQLVPGGTVVNQNPTLNTTMNNMDHWANDLGLTAKFPVGAGRVTARAAYYHYDQNIAMDWHWNGFLTDAAGNSGARIDLFSANGTALTDGGITGYNTGFGGFNRRYDLNYKGDAPYASLNYQDDRIDLDGSIRYDNLKASGSFFQTAAAPSSLDVNGDGRLSVAEQNTYLNSGVRQAIDYSVHYTSWSVGANYRFTPSTAVFARVSKGYRANADRLATNDRNVFNADGSLAAGGKAQAVNPVTQQEVGIKQRGNVGAASYGVFLTGFRSQATEYNIDIDARGVTQLDQRYKTYGAELETQASLGSFAVNANLVYTHSRIVRDMIGGNAGNVPRAQPDFQWTISPSFNRPFGSVGFVVIGQTATYPNDDNVLRQKGVTTVNAFVSVHPVEKLTLSLNAANIFNTFDQAGRLDQGSRADLAANGALFGVPFAATNRVATGRTVSASAAYEF